ncbi:hypothetical protein EV360DRAFT_75794, partial [Lentinula raphanica]
GIYWFPASYIENVIRGTTPAPTHPLFQRPHPPRPGPSSLPLRPLDPQTPTRLPPPHPPSSTPSPSSPSHPVQTPGPSVPLNNEEGSSSRRPLRPSVIEVEDEESPSRARPHPPQIGKPSVTDRDKDQGSDMEISDPEDNGSPLLTPKPTVGLNVDKHELPPPPPQGQDPDGDKHELPPPPPQCKDPDVEMNTADKEDQSPPEKQLTGNEGAHQELPPPDNDGKITSKHEDQHPPPDQQQNENQGERPQLPTPPPPEKQLMGNEGAHQELPPLPPDNEGKITSKQEDPHPPPDQQQNENQGECPQLPAPPSQSTEAEEEEINEDPEADKPSRSPSPSSDPRPKDVEEEMKDVEEEDEMNVDPEADKLSRSPLPLSDLSPPPPSDDNSPPGNDEEPLGGNGGNPQPLAGTILAHHWRLAISIVECYTNFGTRLRGVVPETYLWIGDLLISLDQTQFVPSTGLDQVLSNRGGVLHSLGKIQTNLDLDQVLMHVDSANLNFFTAHDYEGNAKQVEIWTQKENKWSEADEAAEAIATGAQGKSIEKFSTSTLKRWKFSDGFIYALWVNKAITDEQFKRWVTDIRVQCVDRLVTRTDTRISSRKKQFKKLQPSTDVELPPHAPGALRGDSDSVKPGIPKSGYARRARRYQIFSYRSTFSTNDISIRGILPPSPSVVIRGRGGAGTRTTVASEEGKSGREKLVGGGKEL